jgi:AcrR family transcriptional regulator
VARPDAADSLAARERIKDAIVDLVLERGYEQVGVGELLARAEVDQAAFERHFADKQACFLWAFDHEVERLHTALFGTYEEHDNWRDGIRATAYAFARFVREDPRFIRYMTIAMSERDMAQVHRDRAMQAYVELVDRGRQELEDPDSVGRSAAETTIGSIFSVVRTKAAAGELGGNLIELVPSLMYILVRPYLGEAVAREELSITPPEL